MNNKIICIGRQFGSGGYEIAARTAQRLGIRMYDKDILYLACQYGELEPEILEVSDEKAFNPYLFHAIFDGNYRVLKGLPASKVLFELQSHEIRRIASEESCIFVGRCADYVLRDEPVSLLRVFVSAPFEQRVRHKAELEKLPEKKARQLVTKMDKQRKKYYDNYTGQIWGDPQFYDLNIDTGRISVDEAVNLIVSGYARIE